MLYVYVSLVPPSRPRCCRQRYRYVIVVIVVIRNTQR